MLLALFWRWGWLPFLVLLLVGREEHAEAGFVFDLTLFAWQAPDFFALWLRFLAGLGTVATKADFSFLSFFVFPLPLLARLRVWGRSRFVGHIDLLSGKIARGYTISWTTSIESSRLITK